MKILKPNPKSWKVYKSTGVKGSWLDYVADTNDANEMDNFIFEATLVPAGVYRGRSAAGFTFIDADTGDKLTMRIQKVEELMQAIAQGKLEVVPEASAIEKTYSGKTTHTGGFKGKFTFFKQGSNYSIGLVNE